MKLKMVDFLHVSRRRLCSYLWCFLFLLAAVSLVIFLLPGNLLDMVKEPGTGTKLGSILQQLREEREKGRVQFPNFEESSETPESQHQKFSRIRETRLQLMKEMCAKYKSSIPKTIERRHVSSLYVEDKHKVLYCQVPKAGCSNWKRILIVLAGKAKSAEKLKHGAVHFGGLLRLLNSFDQEEIMHRLKTYTKILFVREPFERMVSAYRDKFGNPDKYYHSSYGRPIIARYRKNASAEALKTGDGVTFKEFVQQLVDVNRPVGMDIHWNQVNQLCHPCLIDYDFIGKFEDMEEESKFALQLAGAPSNITLPSFKDRNVADKRTSVTITEQYFSQISLAERQRVYDFYYMDYLMFNYSKPFNDLY